MMVKVAVPEKFKLRIVPNVRTVLFGGQQEIHYIEAVRFFLHH